MRPIIILAALALCGCESKQETQQLYSAWCKAHSNTNLTFEEWSALRVNYLLPGQPPRDSSGDLATGVAIGIAAGSAGAAGGRR